MLPALVTTGWGLQEQHLEQYRQQQPGAIPYLEASGLWLYKCDDGLSVCSLKSSTPFFHHSTLLTGITWLTPRWDY